ncbi:MAG: TlpA disulfide reductase family protein [Bacteroidota bacterium]
MKTLHWTLFLALSLGFSPFLPAQSDKDRVEAVIADLEKMRALSYQSSRVLTDAFDATDTTFSQTSWHYARYPFDTLTGYRYWQYSRLEDRMWHNFYDGGQFLDFQARANKLVIHDFSAHEKYSRYYCKQVIQSEQFIPKVIETLKGYLHDSLAHQLTIGDTLWKGQASLFVSYYSFKDSLNNQRHTFFLQEETPWIPAYIVLVKSLFNGMEISQYRAHAFNKISDTYPYHLEQDTLNHLRQTATQSRFNPDEEDPKYTLLKAGTPAPAWTLPDTEGDSVSLGHMKGKLLLLKFWFIGCPYCIKSEPVLKALQQKYQDQDFHIVTINSEDKAEKVKQYVTNGQWPFLNLHQATQVAQEAYHAYGGPHFYLVDQEGVIQFSRSGFSEDLEEVLSIEIDKHLQP